MRTMVAIGAVVAITAAVYGQAIPPGVNPSDLIDPHAGNLKKAPPVTINTNDELAVATEEYNKVHSELQDITVEKARLQGEMRKMYSGSAFDPESSFGTNDAEYAKMRIEVKTLEKRLKDLREELLKRQQAMPEYKKLVGDMQDSSKRIQELEKRRRTLYQDRTYLVSKMNNIKRMREEEAKKAKDASGSNTTVQTVSASEGTPQTAGSASKISPAK